MFYLVALQIKIILGKNLIHTIIIQLRETVKICISYPLIL